MLDRLERGKCIEATSGPGASCVCSAAAGRFRVRCRVLAVVVRGAGVPGRSINRRPAS